MATKYILRFDDVCPGMAWSRFLPLKDKLQKLDIKCVLGVVPECRDRSLKAEADRDDFYDRVREWVAYGDAIAQHGTYHLYDTCCAGILGINKRSEFAGHNYRTQLDRLHTGKEILVKEGVWQPWFMAPAHSFDNNTLDALRFLGFRALTDGYGFYPYLIRGLVMVPQIASFPLRISFGYQTICVHVNILLQDQITRLSEFVERKSGQFVDFKHVADMEGTDSLYSKWLRISSAYFLRSCRRLRINQTR